MHHSNTIRRFIIAGWTSGGVILWASWGGTDLFVA